jgi:hypothetical protein
VGLIYQGEDILESFLNNGEYMEEYKLEDIEVRDWTETGLELTWDEGGVREQPDTPNLIVYHWTGGEGSAKTVHNTLRKRETRDGRGLSCHLYIDYAGVVWQYCDLDTITRHASTVNGRSLGIEMQNRAFPYKNKETEKKVAKRAPRGLFRREMMGRNVSILNFSGEQMVTMKTLTHILCDAFDIPKVMPGDEAKVDAADESVDEGFVLTDRLPAHAWSTFRGVCGHYHVHRKGTKLDPGPQVFDELWDSGFGLVYASQL